MSKVLKEAPLTTRNARSKLPSGYHWRAIDPDTHLGYRKGERGGRWLVRWRVGKGYAQFTLARADDAFDANGAEVLDFHQATVAARAHVKEARSEAKAVADGPVLTVTTAIDDYLKKREARERAERGDRGLKRDARSRLTRYVMSAPLATVHLHKLTDRDLSSWREALPADLSPGSVRRTVNDLKAALNAAARKDRGRLPPDLPGHIKAGLATVDATPAQARQQVLPDPDVRRIVSAAWAVDSAGNHEGDLARLILVLAATGARFGQVAALRVADVQAKDGRIMVPVSKKGRGTKSRSHIGVRVGSDVLDALKPVLAGRKGTERLLLRWRHVQVKGAEWVRDHRGPWQSASELARPWVEIVRTAELPEVVPYSLRHSSIVRGLRSNLPVRLVAALHDTSSAMIERHYAAYVVDALDDLAARAVVPLTAAKAEVVSLANAKAGSHS